MDLMQLKKELVENRLRTFYCFIGIEREVINIYIKKIKAVSNYQQKNVDKLSDVISNFDNNNFLDEKYIYIISNDVEFIKKEKLAEKIIKDKINGDHIIIMVYPSIDKRCKFYHDYADHITEFEKMSVEVIARQIKKEIGLRFDLAEDLAKRCDCLYGVVLLECDKLKTYSGIIKLDIDQTYTKAIQEKLIYTNPTDVVFDFIEKVLMRNAGCFRLYDEIQFIIDSPLQLISLLYSNFRNLLLVQSCLHEKNIASITGLSDWIINKIKQYAGNYEISELIDAVRLLQKIEQGIKTGGVDQEFSINYFLVRIL